MDSRWLTVEGAGGFSVTGGLTGSETFHWGASRYSAEVLEKARHPCDLVEGGMVLRLDAEVAGTGSAACGPGVREEFEVKCKEVEFGFVLEPVGI